MWDASLYNDEQVDTNSLRCILLTDKGKNTPDRQTYFENMSRAMAIQCAVSATVMDKDPKNPVTDGIWYLVEFDQLQKNTGDQKINTITGRLPDGTSPWIYWPYSTNKRAVGELEAVAGTAGVGRRATCGVDATVAAQFDEGGDYPVKW